MKRCIVISKGIDKLVKKDMIITKKVIREYWDLLFKNNILMEARLTDVAKTKDTVSQSYTRTMILNKITKFWNSEI